MRRPGWLSGRLGDPDATHSLRPPRSARPRLLPMVLAVALLLAVLVALLGIRRAPLPPASGGMTLPWPMKQAC